MASPGGGGLDGDYDSGGCGRAAANAFAGFGDLRRFGHFGMLCIFFGWFCSGLLEFYNIKGGQRRNLEITDVVGMYFTLATFKSPENHQCSKFLIEAFLRVAFGIYFCDFGSRVGSLLATVLVTVWVPSLHRCSDP